MLNKMRITYIGSIYITSCTHKQKSNQTNMNRNTKSKYVTIGFMHYIIRERNIFLKQTRSKNAQTKENRQFKQQQ